jgi:hypothetical protein
MTIASQLLEPAGFDELLRRGAEANGALDGLVTGLQTQIDSVLEWADWLSFDMADGLVEEVRGWLSAVWALIREIGLEFVRFFTEPGVPWTLYDHGNDRVHQVGGPASALVATASADGMTADDHWQGIAATAYLNTLPRQAAAVAAVKAATDQLDSALLGVAFGIVAFWLAVVAALIALVIELTAETAAAGTVVGAPIAAAGAGLSASKAFAIIGGAVTAFIAYLTVIFSQCATIEQLLSNNNAFPDGHWPHPSIDLSDGSITDGDGTGWHVKI